MPHELPPGVLTQMQGDSSQRGPRTTLTVIPIVKPFGLSAKALKLILFAKPFSQNTSGILRPRENLSLGTI